MSSYEDAEQAVVGSLMGYCAVRSKVTGVFDCQCLQIHCILGSFADEAVIDKVCIKPIIGKACCQLSALNS